jgi:hypothetical protein
LIRARSLPQDRFDDVTIEFSTGEANGFFEHQYGNTATACGMIGFSGALILTTWLDGQTQRSKYKGDLTLVVRCMPPRDGNQSSLWMD